ncbi:MAG: GNAT family N-acetyltransferase [Chloroflexota bacterium]
MAEKIRINELSNSKSTPKQVQLCNAGKSDYTRIANFLNKDILAHRHLDWKSALGWLGDSPYLYEEKEDEITALLCCTPENPDAAWVRAFASVRTGPYKTSWHSLLACAVEELHKSPIKKLASLALQEWFEVLLIESGFTTSQSIIVLEWMGTLPPLGEENPNITIRPMFGSDLPFVQQIDAAAFMPLWQNSLPGLRNALHHGAYSTIAILDGKIVAYQISTSLGTSAHLARLAVLPEYRKVHIAYSLVRDLLKCFDEQGIWRLTVNTQSDNQPSLNLYNKIGFKRSGDSIRVYTLNL